MKKILFTFLILTFISCSNDSVSDISETTENNSEENTEDNSDDTTTKTTFTKDILPIINNKCSSCHVSGGSQTDYTVYNSAKNNANLIVNRINRNQGTGGFMPQNGTKLPTAELEKFNQWIADGKLE